MWEDGGKSLRFSARHLPFRTLTTWTQVYLLFTTVWPYVLGCLASVLLVSGLDDLVPGLICLWHDFLKRKRTAVRPGGQKSHTNERRIAIFVPCWKESDVIANMVRHNLAAVRYRNYDFFLGVYPNDQPTVMVVRQLVSAFPNVHIAECPHSGPTSKADCLNWVYRRMETFERERSIRFDTVVLHDAEDQIHPEALSVINRERIHNAMVQVPVLPLPTPLSDLTHGVYCDDFAEYQIVDMRARQLCRSFVPSNGVGTGFARHLLEQLGRERGGLVFDPTSLTEDYEIGVYIYRAGYSQVFTPLAKSTKGYIATREYFPRRVYSAIRQRTRWVTGIGLQSWARDGWRGSLLCKYWFWRDRKGLLANPLSLLTNMLFLAGLANWLEASILQHPWIFAVDNPRTIALCWMTSALQCVRLSMRMFYTGKLYGPAFALGVPVRQFHANYINCVASLRALWQYADARLHGHPLAWAKTEHAYPANASLQPLSRDLAEVLVAGRYVSDDIMARIQDELRSDQFLADLLVQRGLLAEEDARKAISAKAGVPCRKITEAEINPRAAHVLPRHLREQFGVLPFLVETGKLLIAGTRVPPPEFYQAARRFTMLPVEFHLLSHENFRALVKGDTPEQNATESLVALHKAVSHPTASPDSVSSVRATRPKRKRAVKL
jgi:bacteriophage N4 adsorption protein B